jgi:ectoine hydroxylase-related dioxygenase (phytanoyl-CoA dioxygenase family)
MKSSKLHLWHDQIFSKPAKNGSVVAWHQDFSYWTRTYPMNHMTVHITLDDQTEDNGVLMYVPGSHKWPLLPITSRHFNDMDSITTALDDAQKEQFSHRRAASLKAGFASFHHPLCVHGSYSNKSERTRRATVVNLFAHGTKSDVDTPLLEGLPAYPKGGLLEGKFFPVLYDRS